MTLLRNSIVKIRKPHLCHGCADRHLPGSKMNVVVSIDGGKASSSYWCGCCTIYYAKYMENDDEGISLGDLMDESHYREFRASYIPTEKMIPQIRAYAE